MQKIQKTTQMYKHDKYLKRFMTKEDIERKKKNAQDQLCLRELETYK